MCVSVTYLKPIAVFVIASNAIQDANKFSLVEVTWILLANFDCHIEKSCFGGLTQLRRQSVGRIEFVIVRNICRLPKCVLTVTHSIFHGRFNVLCGRHALYKPINGIVTDTHMVSWDLPGIFGFSGKMFTFMEKMLWVTKLTIEWVWWSSLCDNINGFHTDVWYNPQMVDGISSITRNVG